MRDIEAGEIYICELNGIGSEQQGIRPVLVVSNEKVCSNSPTVQVLPLSKKVNKATYLPTHFILYKSMYDFLTYDSVVLGECINTIDKYRLRNKLGKISDCQLQKIINNTIKTLY